MATMEELEHRIAALERLVDELRNQTGRRPLNANWVEQTAKLFENVPPEALEAMHRYGREFRESHPYPGEEDS